MLPREQERHRSLIYRAGLLADTGHYDDWRDIEAALLSAGREDASRNLTSAHVRHALNRRCIRAKRSLSQVAHCLAPAPTVRRGTDCSEADQRPKQIPVEG